MLCFSQIFGYVAHFVMAEFEFGIGRIKFAGAELTADIYDFCYRLTHQLLHYSEQHRRYTTAYNDKHSQRNQNRLHQLAVRHSG